MMSDKQIIRVAKNPDNPFVMMDKRPINDDRLSWKAKGLLAYFLSKPDDWQIHVNDLIKRSTDGAAAVRSGLDELQEYGYLSRSQPKLENGQFASVEYTVYEVPLCEKPQAENPHTDKPQAENRSITNTDSTDNDSTDIDGASAPPPPTESGKRKKESAPIPEAVKVFRQNVHRYPAKSWYEAVDTIVGDDPDALERWGKLCHEWVGRGWKPTNVSGMLDCYQKGGIDGRTNGTHQHGGLATISDEEGERLRAGLRARQRAGP